MHTRTKQEKDEGACEWHMLMMSQRTIKGEMVIYQRVFPGILQGAQLGTTE